MLEKKIRRYTLIDIHMKLVKSGKYEVAKKLMNLLRKGKISLGLDDASWEVETICRDAGCRFNFSRNGYECIAYI